MVSIFWEIFKIEQGPFSTELFWHYFLLEMNTIRYVSIFCEILKIEQGPYSPQYGNCARGMLWIASLYFAHKGLRSSHALSMKSKLDRYAQLWIQY